MGFEVACDKQYAYSISNQKTYRELDSLLLFSTEDRLLLKSAIQSLEVNERKKEVLANKLNTLYDFRQLGHSFLLAPYLEMVDLLMAGSTKKRQVVLEQYHSSTSNTISDRLVEPFKVNIEEDTVQTFDVDKGVVKHFRISRAVRVRMTDSPWTFEARHFNREIDPFRIVNNDQVMVRLSINLAAKNELVERFPATRAHILPTSEPERFHFQCKVNRNFYGLSNFILGFHIYGGVEVLAPESLRQHLLDEVGKFKL
jgi:predicted DNA-binding transcriptional regulator YafY